VRTTTTKRSTRIAERAKEELASAIARELRDPRVAEVLVTRVHVTDDLGLCRVYFRLTTGGADLASRKRARDGLFAAAGVLRRVLGGALGLRRSPTLDFHYDEAQEKTDRIEAVLAEIKKEHGETE
jgi:ribosome-binding factor A